MEVLGIRPDLEADDSNQDEHRDDRVEGMEPPESEDAPVDNLEGEKPSRGGPGDEVPGMPAGQQQQGCNKGTATERECEQQADEEVVACRVDGKTDRRWGRRRVPRALSPVLLQRRGVGSRSSVMSPIWAASSRVSEFKMVARRGSVSGVPQVKSDHVSHMQENC